MSKDSHDSVRLSRRGLLTAAGAGVLAAATAGVLPRLAHAGPAETDKFLSELIGGAQVQEGKVEIQLPEIAENGNTVPFTVTVDSPMTEANHVKAIHVVAEGNPRPEVASFYLGPDSGKAEVAMRMRLAKTQNVRAVAVMNDGSAWGVSREVKVTIGGCGG